MWFRVILPLVVIPLVELSLLVRIARSTSLLAVAGLVLAGGAIGVWLIRRQGLRALRRIEANRSQGAAPSEGMMDAPLLIAAGFLFIVPGVLTDAFALFLLIPAVRKRLGARLAGAFRSRIMVFGSSGFARREDMVDAEVVAPDDMATARANDSHDMTNRMIGA